MASKTVQKFTKKEKYSNELLEKALEAVKSKSMNISQASDAFQVPKSTICDSMAGRVGKKSNIFIILMKF